MAKCNDCSYFKPHVDNPEFEIGYCFRYPVTEMIIDKDHWCGEYHMKIDLNKQIKAMNNG